MSLRLTGRSNDYDHRFTPRQKDAAEKKRQHIWATLPGNRSWKLKRRCRFAGFHALVRSTSFEIRCGLCLPSAALCKKSLVLNFFFFFYITNMYLLGRNGHEGLNQKRPILIPSMNILMGLLWHQLGFLAHFRHGPVLGRVPILGAGPSSPSIRHLAHVHNREAEQKHSVHVILTKKKHSVHVTC